MVERIFIHNYKGFVNFEMKFGRTVLLVGRNGSGKSSLIDVLHFLLMVIKEGAVSDYFKAYRRFRFGDFPTQRFELDIRLGAQLFQYRLELGYGDQSGHPFVIREELSADGEELFLLQDGVLLIVGTRTTGVAPLTIDKHRGGVALVFESHLPRVLKDWIQGFFSLKLVPSTVGVQAKRPRPVLTSDGSDFVAFYETVSNADTSTLLEYVRKMQEVLPGLLSINLKPLYRSGKLWEVEFQTEGKRKASFTLDELSDGQIGLVIHYALLHFCVRRGMTVALDEPDNYLALAEIEPLVRELEDATDQERGQIFLISHHPEIYNRWANDAKRCRYLARTAEGLFVARSIDWNEHSGLMPAEVVARGWEDA